MMHGAHPVEIETQLSTKQMPDRSVLESILDEFEKIDTGRVFAPLRSNEVYYGVSEKTMDFGKIRAKLEEGSYKELEKFKEDVFRITKDSMYVHADCTDSFRQAHAIYILAKSLFKDLEGEPGRAKVNVSLMGRGKSIQGESEGSHVDLEQLDRRNIVRDGGPSARLHAGPKKRRNTSSLKNESNASSLKNERSQTTKQTSTVLTVDDCPQLLPVNENIRYEDSLMRFVEGLGPKALEVARKKLSCLNRASNNHPYAPGSSFRISSSATQLLPDGVDVFRNGSTSFGVQSPSNVGCYRSIAEAGDTTPSFMALLSGANQD